METVNHECYVSLEVAKLLKEAGFDWLCNHAICCDSTHYPNLKEGNVLEYNYLECSELMEGKKPHMLLCPTLAVAQRWLREVKNCYAGVEVFVHDLDANNIYYTYNWVVYFNGDRYSGSDFDTSRYYEVAQEAGIKKALEIILEKGE